MLQFFGPFLPPAALFGAVFFFEQCCSSVSRRFIAWAAVTAISLRGIFAPSPYNNPLANYLVGFFSFWYIIWSTNLLLVKDLTTLGRIKKQPFSSSTAYVLQPLPSSHSCDRLFWAMDLSLNFRAIGWNFSSRQSDHPQVGQTHLQAEIHASKSQATGSSPELGKAHFLWRQAWRLLVSSTWFTGYPCLVRGAGIPIPAVIQHHRNYAGGHDTGSLLDLLSVATTLYMFMDGIHAIISLLAVGLLGEDQWRYPPFFGPVKYLLSGRLQDLWGKFWHDLLKDGLLSVVKGALPWKQPKLLWSVLRIWACFVLTGAVHVSASYTVSRQPLPSLCAGVFYCLQPLGILIQMSIIGAVQTLLPKSTVSIGLQRILEFAIGLLWLYCCFPWVADDPALRQAIGVINYGI
ncbi:hypothetical protein BJX76DRAFT_354961 [Aspergillus varians]